MITSPRGKFRKYVSVAEFFRPAAKKIRSYLRLGLST